MVFYGGVLVGARRFAAIFVVGGGFDDFFHLGWSHPVSLLFFLGTACTTGFVACNPRDL